MNKGINAATGDIIGILNSDDIFYTNSIISDIVNLFDRDVTIDAVYGNISYFAEGNTQKSAKMDYQTLLYPF